MQGDQNKGARPKQPQLSFATRRPQTSLVSSVNRVNPNTHKAFADRNEEKEFSEYVISAELLKSLRAQGFDEFASYSDEQIKEKAYEFLVRNDDEEFVEYKRNHKSAVGRGDSQASTVLSGMKNEATRSGQTTSQVKPKPTVAAKPAFAKPKPAVATKPALAKPTVAAKPAFAKPKPAVATKPAPLKPAAAAGQSYQDRYKEQQKSRASFGSKKGNVDVEDENGKTALYRAVEECNFDEVKNLIQSGADEDYKSKKNKDLETPYNLCAKRDMCNISPGVDTEPKVSKDPVNIEEAITGESDQKGDGPYRFLLANMNIAIAQKKIKKINKEFCSIS